MIEHLKVLQTKEPTYPPRTKHNAGTSHWTVAIAFDFESRGEKLTWRAADFGKKYTAIHAGMDPLDAARLLYRDLRDANATILNVAGNCVDTFIEHGGWNQNTVSRFVHAVLEQVHKHWKLEMVKSGGQTGADLAGGVAGVMLGLPTEMTFPNGYLQRNAESKTVNNTPEQIKQQVLDEIDYLQSLDAPLIPQSRIKRPAP